MIGLAQPDRWTCPTCRHTTVPRTQAGDTARLHQLIRAAQQQHAVMHNPDQRRARTFAVSRARAATDGSETR